MYIQYGKGLNWIKQNAEFKNNTTTTHEDRKASRASAEKFPGKGGATKSKTKK